MRAPFTWVAPISEYRYRPLDPETGYPVSATTSLLTGVSPAFKLAGRSNAHGGYGGCVWTPRLNGFEEGLKRD